MDVEELWGISSGDMLAVLVQQITAAALSISCGVC